MLLDIEDMKLLYQILKEEKLNDDITNTFHHYLKYTPYMFAEDDSSSPQKQIADHLQAIRDEVWLDGFKLIDLDIFHYYTYEYRTNHAKILQTRDRNFAEYLLAEVNQRVARKFFAKMIKKEGKEHFFTTIVDYAITQWANCQDPTVKKHYYPHDIAFRKERFFCAMMHAEQYFKKNNKDVKLNELILRGLHHLCLQNQKGLQKMTLSMILAFIDSTPKYDYLVKCFANFVTHNESIGEKAQNEFGLLKEKISSQEISPYVDKAVLRRYTHHDDSGIQETLTMGASFSIDPSVVKQKTGYRADYILSNLSNFSKVFYECFNQVDGFISASSQVNKAGKFTVSFANDENALNNQQFVKEMINFVALSTISLSTDEILETAQRMKQAYHLQKTLIEKPVLLKPKKI